MVTGSISIGSGSLMAGGSSRSSVAGKESAAFHHILMAASLGDMSIRGNDASMSQMESANAALADTHDSLADALAAYKREAKMTPAQRARRDILEKMHLTEDSIKAMPPEEQDATEKVIAEQVARRLKLSEYARSHQSR